MNITNLRKSIQRAQHQADATLDVLLSRTQVEDLLSDIDACTARLQSVISSQRSQIEALSAQLKIAQDQQQAISQLPTADLTDLNQRVAVLEATMEMRALAEGTLVLDMASSRNP